MLREAVSVRIGWICLALVSVGILGFGLVEALAPVGADSQLYRADGLASTGLGLFGGMVALFPFRRRERWAWGVFWFYPVFWLAHLIGQLPPGKDHIHQVVFIVLSLVGLLLPVREFFRSTSTSATSATGSQLV